MSAWGRVGVLLAGAAVGYVAAKRGRAVAEAAGELVARGGAPARRSDAETPLTRLWGSRAAEPLRRGTLGALRFAATVKQGMQEREAELNGRYATPVERPRAEVWEQLTTASHQLRPQRPAAPPPHPRRPGPEAPPHGHAPQPPEPGAEDPDGPARGPGPRSASHRDDDLPDDFFTGRGA